MLLERDLRRKPTSFEDAPDGKPYLGVGGRGAGCKPYTHTTFGEPATLLDLFPAVQRRSCWFVADGGTLDAVAARYVVAVRNPDRKSTRLNSSHANISYAVFCLKK